MGREKSTLDAVVTEDAEVVGSSIHGSLPYTEPVPGPFGRRIVSVPRRRSSVVGVTEGAPPDELARRERRYRRLLAASDVGSIALVLIACFGVPGSGELRWPVLLGFPAVVLAGKLYGLYDRDEVVVRKTTLDEVPKVFQLVTLYVLAFTLLDRLVVTHPLGAWRIAALWIALVAIVPLARRCARLLAQRATAVERCVLITSSTTVAERMRAKLDATGDAMLVAHLSLESASAMVDDAEGGIGAVRQLVCEHDVHRIIIETSHEDARLMLDFVRAAKSSGVHVSLLPQVLDVVGTSVEFDDLTGMMLLGVRRFGLSRSSRLLKRVFDLCGAVLVLIVALPFMVVLAIAIKMDSRGPVFFRQLRVGRDGRHLRIRKFRTMIADAEQEKARLLGLNEAEGLFKIAEDPRVTRMGRLLRRTSLDELPQLFNVLRGEMSLVGPRPLVLDEDAKIAGLDRYRLALTPGMTGHWQIAGSSRVPLAEMVKIDYLYAAGWSLWTDLKILMRTVPYMLARRGL